MTYFNESQLEQSIITLLQRQGYVHGKGESIDCDLDEVVLCDDLAEYLRRRYKNDGIIKAIMYEGRASHVFVDSELIRQIEAYYDQCADEESSEYQIAESKKAMNHCVDLYCIVKGRR